jgi:hypothetical protein
MNMNNNLIIYNTQTPVLNQHRCRKFELLTQISISVKDHFGLLQLYQLPSKLQLLFPFFLCIGLNAMSNTNIILKWKYFNLWDIV